MDRNAKRCISVHFPMSKPHFPSELSAPRRGKHTHTRLITGGSRVRIPSPANCGSSSEAEHQVKTASQTCAEMRFVDS